MPDVSISLGGFVVLTDIGTAYDTAAAAFGLGSAVIDFKGVTQIDFRVGVNKIGTGTQSWQLWNVTDGAEIGVIDDAGAANRKILTTTINGGAIPNGTKLVRVRAKSTVAGDDPQYLGAAILLVRPTPSFERAGLVEQFIRNVYNLIRNMRDNANGYKAALLPPHNKTPATVAAEMVADAGLYLVRIQWLTDLFTRNLTLARDSLADAGLTTAQATALRDSLTTVAQHTQAATLTNSTQINAEADFILANVPNYERLW